MQKDADSDIPQTDRQSNDTLRVGLAFQIVAILGPDRPHQRLAFAPSQVISGYSAATYARVMRINKAALAVGPLETIRVIVVIIGGIQAGVVGDGVRVGVSSC